MTVVSATRDMELVMSKPSRELIVPARGQSHWCDGYVADPKKSWGDHQRSCNNVVRNDSDRCAAGHKNKLRPMRTTGKPDEPVADLIPASYEIGDLTDTDAKGVLVERAIQAEADRDLFRELAEDLLNNLASLRGFYEQSAQVDSSERDLVLNSTMHVILRSGKALRGKDWGDETIPRDVQPVD